MIAEQAANKGTGARNSSQLPAIRKKENLTRKGKGRSENSRERATPKDVDCEGNRAGEEMVSEEGGQHLDEKGESPNGMHAIGELLSDPRLHHLKRWEISGSEPKKRRAETKGSRNGFRKSPQEGEERGRQVRKKGSSKS